MSFLLLFAPALMGCAAETEHPPSLDQIGDTGATPRATAGGVQSYPDGPYGRNSPAVGDVLEDLNFLGYRGSGEPIAVSSGPDKLSFSDLRKEGSRYLLIHISSFWCGTCRPEAFYMSQYTREIMEAGGDVLEILVDGDTVGDDPTKEQLDVWVLSSDLQMTTVIPGDDNVRKVFPDRDLVYIVDLETMRVEWRKEGPTPDYVTTEIGALEMLNVWLAK